MSGPSLEEERQAILDRMQMRRERYRRMLTVGGDLDDAEFAEPHATTTHLAATPTTHDTSYRAMHSSAYTPTGYRAMEPMNSGHGPVIRVLMEHPFLCALGVAAVVAIGPRRILRTLTSSGTALTTFAGNQSNVDLAGRLLTMVGAYVQGRTQNHQSAFQNPGRGFKKRSGNPPVVSAGKYLDLWIPSQEPNQANKVLLTHQPKGPIMKKIISILSILMFGLSLTACNTMKGFGKDVERGGEKVQGAADNSKKQHSG